jgi:hypothetical protein
MTRSHVHVLAESGRSHVDIADQLSISERSVRRILREVARATAKGPPGRLPATNQGPPIGQDPGTARGPPAS